MNEHTWLHEENQTFQHDISRSSNVVETSKRKNEGTEENFHLPHTVSGFKDKSMQLRFVKEKQEKTASYAKRLKSLDVNQHRDEDQLCA